MSAPEQVHDEEADVAEHVDPAQGRIEFDAVERHAFAVDAHDVAEVQVAVAFADTAVGHARCKNRRERIAGPDGPVAEAPQRFAEFGRVRQVALQAGEVVERRAAYRLE